MESMMPFEQHFFRSAAAAAGAPLRLFSDFADMDNNNLMNSLEKARLMHHQWLQQNGAPGPNSPMFPSDPTGSASGAGSPTMPGRQQQVVPGSIQHLLAMASAGSPNHHQQPPPPQQAPQLYTLNPNRGSPSPLPLPAHLWSQWSALSQLPPGLLTSHHQLQQQLIAQQQKQQQSISQLRYSAYPPPPPPVPTPPIPQLNTKSSSSSPNACTIPSTLIKNESPTLSNSSNNSNRS